MTAKILIPLATLAAAGAIVVGSGATFTSESTNTVSAVTSGTLSQSNSKDNAAIFNLTNIKPGDVVNGDLTITNTGSLPATFGLTESTSANAFGKGADGTNYLTLSITNTTTGAVVYTGDFGGLVDGEKQTLGVVQPGAVNAYRFSVKLVEAAPNSEQGKTASASYTWDSVQLTGQTYQQ